MTETVGFLEQLQHQYPEIAITAVRKGPDRLHVNRLWVPPEDRNQGLGTQIMKAITEYASRENMIVTLVPSAEFGGQLEKLHDFYSRLGFQPLSSDSDCWCYGPQTN